MIIEIKNENTSIFATVATLHPGMSFGEVALIKSQPRSASILCNSPCHFAVLGKEDYMKNIGTAEMRVLDKKIDFLSEIPFFRKWGKKKLVKLTLYLQKSKYKRNQVVFRYGSRPECVYIVKSGEFEITKPIVLESSRDRQKHFMAKVALASKGEIFCESEVMYDAENEVTCTCYSTEGELYTIPASNFKLVFTSKYNVEERKNKALRSLIRETRINHFKEYLQSKDPNLSVGSLGKTITSGFSRSPRPKSNVEQEPKWKFTPLNENQLEQLRHRAMGSVKARRQYIHLNTPIDRVQTEPDGRSLSPEVFTQIKGSNSIATSKIKFIRRKSRGAGLSNLTGSMHIHTFSK